MFKTNNEKIEKHLGNLIKNSEHKNDRQFCIAYLTLRDGEANPDDIQKMQNRICQIKNGKKGVQIEDLPIFSDLLGVSIEDILSAGTVLTLVLNRKTNYSIAFSNDPSEWEAYIKRDDKLILNPDEYDKTAIDYALEAGNYPFLKYLTEKGYSATPNNNYYDEAYFCREAWSEYYFYPETGFIAYYMPFYSKNTTGFITNVINVTASSTNAEVQFLIDELKKTYNTFIKQFEKKEA